MAYSSKKIIAALLVTLMLCSALVGFASAEEATVTGNIMLYTCEDDSFISEVVNRFNAKFPNAHAEYFRSGSEEVISKLMAEEMTNSIQADLVQVSDSASFEMLKSKGMLLAYDSPELENIHTDFVDPDHTYYGTFCGSMGICYNTNLVKTPVTSWLDLLSEEAKNNVIMPSPLYSGAACNALLEITRTEGLGWEFYQGLVDNGVTVVNGNGGVKNAVSAGEQAYGMINESAAFAAIEQGSPVGFVYPKEGLPSVSDPIAILNTSANVTAAQAFIDFMLSAEIQELGRDSLGLSPLRKEVAFPDMSMPLEDRTLLIHDAKELFEHREEDKEHFADMFGF